MGWGCAPRENADFNAVKGLRRNPKNGSRLGPSYSENKRSPKGQASPLDDPQNGLRRTRKNSLLNKTDFISNDLNMNCQDWCAVLRAVERTRFCLQHPLAAVAARLAHPQMEY